MIIGVIDDNDEKRADICETLREAAGDRARIVEGRSVSAARRLLLAEQFDLLVLDIALPELDDGLPTNLAGISLLDEVVQNNRYKMPRQVIGLTALDDVYGSAATRFGGELWSVLKHDRTSREWADQLAAKVRHLLRVQQVEAGPGPDVDLVVVTALKNPELDAVLDLPWDWSQLDRPGDPTRYFSGKFQRKNGTSGTVVAARAPQMGMPAAASLTMKMGMHFRPRFIAMVGICAGNKKETNIGDVIAANPTWDYGSGKYSSRGGAKVFEPAPYPLTISSRVRGILEDFEGESQTLGEIRRAYKGTPPETACKLHIGPFASGAAVIARGAMLDEVRDQHRKLMAIDMEAYGVASAAVEMPLPLPEFLVLKGVSDFADEEKGDSLRQYAAFVSARFLAHLCTDKDLC